MTYAKKTTFDLLYFVKVFDIIHYFGILLQSLKITLLACDARKNKKTLPPHTFYVRNTLLFRKMDLKLILKFLSLYDSSTLYKVEDVDDIRRKIVG